MDETNREPVEETVGDVIERQVAQPEEPEVPEIVQRLDNVLREREGEIARRMREIRQDENMQFHGMTRAQIHDRFRVEITGTESYAQLRQLAAAANNLYQEANGYLQDLQTKDTLTQELITEVRTALDREVIVQNLTSRRNDRISDKARENLSDRVHDIAGVREALARDHVEIGMWTSVLKGLDKTMKIIDMNMQSLASESKYARPPGI